MRYMIIISAIVLMVSGPTAETDIPRLEGYFAWPLKRPVQLSSGFGDRRPGRFHMGIDLRIGGQEGEMVYAPEDGYVWRIRSGYRGYGKALYIRGNSGRTYVFGHLMRYNWDIGTYLQRHQIESKRYFQDIYLSPDEIPVKAGDFVARAGQTGIGAPHLHFEVRDQGGYPTNPLLYSHVKLPDNTPPEIEAVWLEYRDDRSLFSNGKREMLLLPDDDTVTVYGRVALKAAVTDYVAPGSFRMGPARLTLLVNDRMYHQMTYNRLSFDENYFSLLDTDADPGKQDYKRVFHLGRRPGNQLSSYVHEIDSDGVIEFPAQDSGYHLIRIEAVDHAGHVAHRTFVLNWRPAISGEYPPGYFARGPDQTDMDEVATIPDSVKEALGKKNEPIPMRGIVDSIWYKINDLGVEIIGYAPDGVDELLIELLTDTEPELHLITSRGRFPLFYVPGNKAAAITGVVFHGKERFNSDTLRLNIHALPSARKHSVVLNDNLTLHLENHDLFSDCLIEAKAVDTILRNVASGYIVAGPYEISPLDLAFADWADLEWRIGDTRYGDKLAMYVYHPEKGWLWAGGEYNENAATLVSSLGGGGIVAVIADTTAPLIANLNIPLGGVVQNSRPHIEFNLTDELAGIEDDLNFDLSLDGQWLVPEYDPERERVTTRPHRPLSPGKHTVRIQVTDRLGNRASFVRNFTYGAEGSR